MVALHRKTKLCFIFLILHCSLFTNHYTLNTNHYSLITNAVAQEWLLPWIGSDRGDSTSQQWFRKTFTIDQRPTVARLYVATVGRFVVYVNGYNVSTAVLEPYDPAMLTDYDATPYLRAGRNTIGVWYSPMPPCRPAKAQIALTLCYTDADGRKHAIATDDGWLCRQANAQSTADGGETIVNSEYVADWNSNDFGVVGWWTAHKATGPQASDRGRRPVARRISSIRGYAFREGEANNVAYIFREPFDGWVRLTLRDMYRGDTIRVGGLTYVCSGDTDEQACRRFTTSQGRVVEVAGPIGFSYTNVTNIEAIDISY